MNLQQPSPTNFDRGRALRPREQARLIGVSRSTLYAIAQSDPTFPPAFLLTGGGRASVRFASDIHKWLAARPLKNGVRP